MQRTKDSSRYKQRALKKLILSFCVNCVVTVLLLERQDRGVGVRGCARRNISAVRVHTYWMEHANLLGCPPSLRTVCRFVRGRGVRRRAKNDELTPVQFSQLERARAAQGW